MKIVKVVLAAVLLAGLAAVGVVTRPTWTAWLKGPAGETAAEEADHHDHAAGELGRLRLSPQARASLRLDVRPVQPTTYWRSLTVPGMVVERPGRSDRGISAPVAGVVRRIYAVPGDRVHPGESLVALRLNSESLQNSQTELYKATRELQISQARLVEVRSQQRRLSAAIQAYRQDLAARGLTPAQIDEAAKGNFVTEFVLRVPEPPPPAPPGAAGEEESAAEEREEYEVQELKVNLGEQVQAGQVLCLLANHQHLYVEGRGFKTEVATLARAAEQGWPLAATFADEASRDWPPLTEELKIRFLANTVEPASQTFPFYVPLANQHRDYKSGGKTYRVWRFRPGQRLRLRVPVERLDGVFVLPAAALARDGVEAYVFRQNGDAFEPKPVRVLHEEENEVVLANDGSLTPGSHVAHGGAAALLRALKAQSAGGDGHGHDHHGHSH
jgi:multidrug efflux pump subunit AcrA (membrane-fusion protein)